MPSWLFMSTEVRYPAGLRDTVAATTYSVDLTYLTFSCGLLERSPRSPSAATAGWAAESLRFCASKSSEFWPLGQPAEASRCFTWPTCCRPDGRPSRPWRVALSHTRGAHGRRSLGAGVGGLPVDETPGAWSHSPPNLLEVFTPMQAHLSPDSARRSTTRCAPRRARSHRGGRWFEHPDLRQPQEALVPMSQHRRTHRCRSYCAVARRTPR